jgi:hypothetical protein
MLMGLSRGRRLGTGRLLNRRSKGHGPESHNVVKQKANLGVPLPQDIVEILSLHVETQLDPRQLKSRELLLFRGAKGADYRSMSSLAKPFAVRTCLTSPSRAADARRASASAWGLADHGTPHRRRVGDARLTAS